MALETRVTEIPFQTGQDEGTAVEVLPVGTFSRLQNARYRKVNQIGKRNGYDVKTSLDASGAPLGNGAGRLACLGPEFCVVDDRYYRRNTVNDTWTVAPVATGAQARRLANRFPEFMPASIVETTTQESLAAAQDQEGGMTYALGYIWTAEGRALNAGGWVIHVDAIDVTTRNVVQSYDIELAAAVNTDLPHVQLVTTLNGAVVLVTDAFTAGAKTGLTWYVLTSLAGGFGAATTTNCVQSAVNYATAANRADHILCLRVLTGALTTVRFSYLNVLTAFHNDDLAYAVGGNKTLLSVFQGAFQNIVRGGWADGGNAFVQTRSVAMGLIGTQNFTALIAGSIAPLWFAETSLGTAVAIAGNSSSTVLNQCAVDSAGNFVAGATSVQLNYSALSWPFTIESRVFIWARYTAGNGLGVASLLRVALGNEYSSATTPGVWPLQATVDDRDVDLPFAVTHTSGPPISTPLATPLGYVALINYTRETSVGSGGTTVRRRGYMLVPVQHRSGGLRYSPSCVIPCCGRQFVASAQPMWVDRIAPYEAGFVQAPTITGSTPAAGGSLTPSSVYSWSVIFQSSDSGAIERSGPAVPDTVTLGAGDSKCTLTITTYETGNRRQVAARVYRTAANGSVFYFVGEAEASPGAGTTGTFTFIDTTADTDIIQNEDLYTQIGQEQAASNWPACSFSNTGGSRLWVGGGFTGNVVQASKLFVPRIIPEFVDDDAWRITLPSECTGMAWCDAQVLFTQEGIYVVGGDGPDVAGEGFFTTSRLPFDIGCIDWRSVDATDAGIFFQSARGLYLLPRGFGTPVQMNQVLDTLSTYPIITSARSSYSSQGGADNSEQVVQWTAVADEEASSGAVITFDLAYQAFSIDTSLADYPAAFQAGWSGESVQAPPLMTQGPNGAAYWHPFRVRNNLHSDGGLAIGMELSTGDVRPWGMFSHGVVNRVGVFGKLGSACTLITTKRTDRGVATAQPRVFSGVAPDYEPGDDFYVEVQLGNAEQRDITALRVTLVESSATEGLAFFGLVIEADNKPQGFRLLSSADRIT